MPNRTPERNGTCVAYRDVEHELRRSWTGWGRNIPCKCWSNKSVTDKPNKSTRNDFRFEIIFPNLPRNYMCFYSVFIPPPLAIGLYASRCLLMPLLLKIPPRKTFAVCRSGVDTPQKLLHSHLFEWAVTLIVTLFHPSNPPFSSMFSIEFLQQCFQKHFTQMFVPLFHFLMFRSELVEPNKCEASSALQPAPSVCQNGSVQRPLPNADLLCLRCPDV